jgi:gliding motility-associated-like protein
MNRNILTFTFLLSLLSVSKVAAQADILMRTATVSTGTCGALFTDSGGKTANNQANPYRNNENSTITICSDNPAYKYISLGFDELDVLAGDELCIYDGRNTTDPALLLGCASDFANTRNYIIETTVRNPTGCMTITFRSDATGTGRGWAARVMCMSACQTVRAQIEETTPKINPVDTGWIDGCPGTRVSFLGKGIYPFNNIAYRQSDSLSKFEWNFGDGSPIAYGKEVDHIYTQSGGFVVKLTVTDTAGCKNVNFIKQRVRISPRPNFGLANIPTTVPVGTTVSLKGTTTGFNTNFQVSSTANTATFPIGQVRSEQLFIPDNPAQEYRTSVYFTDFNPGQVLTNVNDLKRVFVNMEHSWARDLEIKVVCPNRQQVITHAYNLNDRATNRIRLGVPRCNNGCTQGSDNTANTNDAATNPAGIGAEYSWTPTGARTIRSYTTPATADIPAGNYRPDQALTGLVGCPLNGEWSIVVKDQFGADNGWIFQWGIEFQQRVYPTLETFTPKLVSSNWVNNQNVTRYMVDSIVAQPRNAGVASFIYQVRDTFGCVFDTIVNIRVTPVLQCTLDFPELSDTAICFTASNGVTLNKASNSRNNPSVNFEAFPYKTFDALTATVLNPDSVTLQVTNVFTPTLTNPITEMDSVCFDINSTVADDVIVQLKAPNGVIIPLLLNGRAGIGQPLKNICFSPSATRPIATATPPLTGLYQGEDGAAGWNRLIGTPINGNWRLLLSDRRGIEKDTLVRWSISFKSGNTFTYVWTPATGLSCTNCAVPNAKPNATTQYVVRVVDNLQCVHQDTVRVIVTDSLPAPALSIGVVTYNSLQFTWPAIAGASSYLVSVDGGPWVAPNGTLSHRVTGLRTNQEVKIRVRAVGGTCGARIGELTEKSADCLATIGRGANRRLEIDSIPCYGQTSPVVNFAFANGVAPFKFWIDTMQQDANPYYRNKVRAGRHLAIFEDNTGCRDSLVFYLGQPDSISITATTEAVRCNGDATGRIVSLARGGKGQLTYTLNSNPLVRNSGTFDSLRALVYTLEVRDSEFCRQTQILTITQPPALTLNLTKTDVRCFGQSTGAVRANINGGTTPYNFSWNNNTTTQNQTNVVAGSYRLIVTDGNGCTRRDSVTLTSNPRIVIATNQDSVKCFGDANGRASARVTGGFAPYIFNWNNNQFDSVATNLRSGVQHVTITDAAGCSDTASVRVLQPDSLRYDSLIVLPASCANTATGSARAFVSGGTSPYRYTWTTGATTPSVTNLGAGNYTVVVRDFNNCQKSNVARVGSAPALVIDDVKVTNVRCFSENNGRIAVSASGGSGAYTYRWNSVPTQTTDTSRNLIAGSYRVTVTDANNCQVVKDTTVTQPQRLNAFVTTFQNVKCRGGSDGTANPTVLGGTPFPNSPRYLYRWNDPTNTDSQNAVNLPAGTYTATVTDANGCTDTANVQISEPVSEVSVTAVQTKLGCAGQSTGEARATAAGGVGSFIYRWSNLQTTQTANSLSKARFYVLATDLNGCRAIDSVDIVTYDSIKATLLATPPTCNNTATGSINVTTVSGGAGGGNLNNYNYRWNSNPSQVTVNATKLTGNRPYSVIVTDNEGCTSEFFQFLTQPGPIVIESAVEDAKCFGSATGSARINVISLSSNFTITWNLLNNPNQNPATNLSAGRYGVTITDSAGCKKDTLITINQPPKLRIDSRTITDNKCVGDTLGKIEIFAGGGTPQYKFLWSNGMTVSNINGLRSGIYTLTLTDDKQCNMTDTFRIKSPEAISADTLTQAVRCFGDQNGLIRLTAFGGTPPYSYSLDGKNYNGISNIVGLRAGSYDVYVRDINNCLWFDKVTVRTPPRFELDMLDTVRIKLGDKTQLFANPINNQGKVKYTWKVFGKDSSLSCLVCQNPIAKPMFTTEYPVTGVDSVGCIATDKTIVIIEKKLTVLVPTAFSPNGDNINDILTPRGENGVKINLFRIYDRWGELLFEARDFTTNSNQFGWNGEFRSQPMNSGKYVWYLEAELMDGTKEVLKGHTTLLR